MAKSREAFRTISEVADWLDVQTHVLRFWESKFSQVKPVKRAGGRRYYRRQDMELLGGLKKLLHEDGMAIKDAQKMLREEGVKHVSSLSRPVDQDQDSLDVTAEESPQETAVEPQDDVLQDLAEDTTISDDTIPSVDDDEAPQDGLTDLPDAEPDTSSDEVSLDLSSAPIQEDDDDAGIPEDLVVKIEDENPPSTKAPEPETLDANQPHTEAEATDTNVADAVPTEPEQDTDAAHLASEGASNDQPQMDDLFASLNTPTAVPATEQPGDAQTSAVVTDPVPDALNTAAPSDASSVEDPSAFPEAPETAFDEAFEPAISDDDTISEPALAPESDMPPPPAGPLASETNAPSFSAADASAPDDLSDAPQSSTVDVAASAVSSATHDTVTEAVTDDADKPSLEAVVARENARDDFLMLLTTPVTVAPQDASRAASLLARLEALHNNAG